MNTSLTYKNFLTQQETDRLPEEKKRGLTINLGYTYFSIEDKTYSIVDVPGHKDFYKNTISGFANADVILFIIDSIQNWSEQSEQHFQSLTLIIYSIFPSADVSVPALLFEDKLSQPCS